MEIEVKNVSYQYQRTNVKALENINLKIRKNQINGILGNTGSGKTTLLELLSFLRIPSDGSIMIGPFCNTKDSMRENIWDFYFRVGFVFQFPEEQFLYKTVREELESGMRFYNYRLGELDKRISEVLKMVGLNDSYLDLKLSRLSSGEKRLIAIATVLTVNPKVLILDDPTVGLDDLDKENLIRLLRLLKQRYHKTIIIASNDIEFMHKLVDYIFILYKGKKVLEGEKYEIFKDDKSLQKFHISVPKVIQIANTIYKRKNIKIGYRDEINDLLKDIYRYAR